MSFAVLVGAIVGILTAAEKAMSRAARKETNANVGSRAIQPFIAGNVTVRGRTARRAGPPDDSRADYWPRASAAIFSSASTDSFWSVAFSSSNVSPNILTDSVSPS
ncbi:hypothetical protein LMG28138_05621 [Pararobbsia alpina]|uniref:Uncharacterized protein n=1 Tax=Pararobbsia alpina TaxID=621374 RepID=A0A6S7C0D0_9BURK|nr:hypothetical protein LMG28138_05621 [Pararobbsia alpina]